MLIVDKLSHDDLTCRTCYWFSADIIRVDVRPGFCVCLFCVGHGFETLLPQRWRYRWC